MNEKYFLYEYNSAGFHNGKVEIDDAGLEDAFRAIVAPAKVEGRKVIITDMGDFCVFHTENGKIIYPTPEMYAAAAKR